LLLARSNTAATVTNGFILLSDEQTRPGASVNLAGDWLYKPGYTVQPGEQPAKESDAAFKPVPVPQLLNRIHWWLEDSEDFQKHETERLKNLSFDTERAEDGWYHLSLNVPALEKETRLFLEFEGVAMKSKFFCNGKPVGEHTGMFSRFGFDLTPHLKPGTNLIAAFVSMERIPSSDLAMGEAGTVNLTASRVRSLSKGMFGPLSPGFDNRGYDLHGIWQPVRLVVHGSASLDDVWFAPSLDGAELRIEGHSATQSQTVLVRAKWTDLETGRTFAELDPEKLLLRKTPSQETLWLRNVQPKLWTPANPNLYRLEVTLEDLNGRVLDRWSHKVGFRTFEIRGNQFFLNGHPWWLRGANHLPYGKNPFDPALPRQLIQLLHDGNVRITRTHATPWNEVWLDAADEIGLAVSVEGVRPWALAGKIGATPPELFRHWLTEHEDVVKRCRNHPSVFIYTVGNEMLLHDGRNLEKWRQLSEVVQATRRFDPTRPVIASSEYQRTAEVYRTLLKPAQIDDGDVDDVHRYSSWYGPSSFVKDANLADESNENAGKRPLIGQEMSTGYPDLDTGLPVLRYTRDLLTPQAWVGQQAYPGSEPAIFLEHHRAVTKRWAEQLRCQRGTNTAGFMLFAAECWFSHSYDPARLAPYPVYEAVREAWAPIGVALETGRRRFYSGEQVETAVFVTNDDEQFRDLAELKLSFSIQGSDFHTEVTNVLAGTIASLPYRSTAKIPVKLAMPEITGKRKRCSMTLRLTRGDSEIARTTEPVELFARSQTQTQLLSRVTILGTGTNLSQLARDLFKDSTVSPSPLEERAGERRADSEVLLVGSKRCLDILAATNQYRKLIEETGATAVLLSPSTNVSAFFPEDIVDPASGEIEFADFAPIAGTPLVEGLLPMDLKWWGRTNDWRAFIGDRSHRLKPNGRARELLRYIPPHSYISAAKVPELYRAVLFEVPLGKGRLWFCDLDLEASVPVDPIARIFAENLLRAAADPASTSKLPKVLSHEELLSRKP
jgi:hypothetical protein